MFVDQTQIILLAGKGGDGCLSFRREKYIPRGGPNGGNGGKGGDIILRADQNMTTLLDLTYRPHLKGQEGANGESWDKAGKGGDDLLVLVPCGTTVFEGEKLLADLRNHGETFLAAHGGRGGRGNSSFKTKIVTAPRIAEKGEPGESVTLRLQLKLIADVGLVGCPNAGKSTLLSRLSAARPKIADYPFTTLSPNLGVGRFGESTYVIADIPGLIEGAHAGKGLGTEFLRHIERTRVLVHLMDPMGFDGKTPLKNYRAILKELALYSPALAKKVSLVVVNKMDLTGAEEVMKKLRKSLKGKKILGISAVSGKGLPELSAEIHKMLQKADKEKRAEVPAPPPRIHRYVFTDEYTVAREEDAFRVTGKKVERLCAMTNFNQDQAVRRFQNILKKMGVERALKKEGAQPGDAIIIGAQEFTFE